MANLNITASAKKQKTKKQTLSLNYTLQLYEIIFKCHADNSHASRLQIKNIAKSYDPSAANLFRGSSPGAMWLQDRQYIQRQEGHHESGTRRVQI